MSERWGSKSIPPCGKKHLKTFDGYCKVCLLNYSLGWIKFAQCLSINLALVIGYYLVGNYYFAENSLRCTCLLLLCKLLWNIKFFEFLTRLWPSPCLFLFPFLCLFLPQRRLPCLPRWWSLILRFVFFQVFWNYFGNFW